MSLNCDEYKKKKRLELGQTFKTSLETDLGDRLGVVYKIQFRYYHVDLLKTYKISSFGSL